MVDDATLERVRNGASRLSLQAAAAGFALTLVTGSWFFVTGDALALQVMLVPLVVAGVAFLANVASSAFLWARSSASAGESDGYAISEVGGDGPR